MREESNGEALMRIWQLMFLQQISQSYQIIYLSFLIWKFDALYLMFLFWTIDIFALTGFGILKIKFKIIVNNFILDTTINVIYKLLLLINIKYYENFQVQYFSYAIMAYYFFRALIQNIRKITNNQQITQYSFIIQGIKLMLVLQIMLVTMKQTDTLNWNWYSVFSLSWGLLTISFIIHFIFILSISETILDYFRNRTSKPQLIGGIWFTLYINAFSVFPLWFLLEVCWEQESNINQSPSILFLVLVAYNGIVYFALCIFFRDIKLFILDMRFSTQPQDLTEKNHKFIKVNIPFQIIQLSSTYFDIVKTERHMVTVSHSNQSVLHQKAKLKAFEFIGKTEHRQLPSPSAEGEIDMIQSQGDKCQICFEAEPNIVMLPCQHGGICEECIIKWLEKSKQCYLCREVRYRFEQKIDKFLRIARGEDEGKFAINDIAICD